MTQIIDSTEELVFKGFECGLCSPGIMYSGITGLPECVEEPSAFKWTVEKGAPCGPLDCHIIRTVGMGGKPCPTCGETAIQVFMREL